VIEVVGPTDEHAVTEMAGAIDELGDETGLADPGFAADEQRGWRATFDALQLLEGRREIQLAADEWCRLRVRMVPQNTCRGDPTTFARASEPTMTRWTSRASAMTGSRQSPTSSSGT
jgi:hypothetical protein